MGAVSTASRGSGSKVVDKTGDMMADATSQFSRADHTRDRSGSFDESRDSSSIGLARPNFPEARVRIVKRSEYKAAAACLAEAFVDDHVIRYPIDTPDRAHWTKAKLFNLHRQIMEYVTYANGIKGLVTAVGEGFDCVALWMPPGKNIDDWCTILRSGLWQLKFKLSAEGRKRFFREFLPLLHSTKAETMGHRDCESWYLVYLGTRRSSRGKGYARKLVEHVTVQVSPRSSEGEAVSYAVSPLNIEIPKVGRLLIQKSRLTWRAGPAIWRAQTMSIPSFIES
jgi:hypothetical protein